MTVAAAPAVRSSRLFNTERGRSCMLISSKRFRDDDMSSATFGVRYRSDGSRPAPAHGCRHRRIVPNLMTSRPSEVYLSGGPDDVTALLLAVREKRPEALDRLMPLVYDELKRIAHNRLRVERDDHSLDTTALVHETYLKLIDQTRVEWKDRTHFFAVASTLMRRILVDYARRHGRAKRGGDRRRVPLDATRLAVEDEADRLIALDEALERLATLDARLSQVVEYRFFGGLTEKETAEALQVTVRTVERYWVKAKALLYLDLAVS